LRNEQPEIFAQSAGQEVFSNDGGTYQLIGMAVISGSADLRSV
jgi:hypothetical protein